jgi:hypothetical protein
MRLSKTDLKILEQIAKGNKNIKTISYHIDKSDKQIYKSAQKLKNNNFLELRNGKLEPRKISHVTLLLQVLSQYPIIIDIISGSGLKILSLLVTPKTVKQITQETGLRKTVIYEKIKQAQSISAVTYDEKHRYVINEKIWPILKRFLEDFKRYNETIDPRVPANSIIYYKNDKEIVFSNKEELNASLTGFSAYEKYGIKLLVPTNYYYLPKKTLTKKQVFLHSLYIAQREKDIRNVTYIGLFYLKYKKELHTNKHPIVMGIKRVLKGEKIEGYPTLKELMEKADTYDIRW